MLKQKLTALVFLFVLCQSANAAPKWLRYAGAAAICGLSAMDLGSTAYGVAHGAQEANSFLSDGGNVRWGRAIPINVGTCAGAIVIAKFGPRIPTPAALGVYAPLIGYKTMQQVRNLRVIESR